MQTRRLEAGGAGASLDETAAVAERASAPARLYAVLVHVFTASGAATGFLALDAAFERRFAIMFAWLGLALFIDGIDGTLARVARVKERAPAIDGDVLDLVVDYLTYVIVPAVALSRSDLLPFALATPLALIVVVTSALYFADKRMKTPDLWFRGFPAIWNVLVFYLLVLRFAPLANAAIVLVAAIAMFLPFAFVHPLRVTQLRRTTLAVVGVFGIAAVIAVAADLQPSWPVRVVLGACGLYVLALPFLRRRLTA